MTSLPPRLEMFLTGSWFWRGFQSAIFYYISCAPCSKLNYRRKRRKQLKREKALREAEEGFQHHPSPFSTNPYWNEEIALGPGPPQRKANRDGKGKSKDSRGLRTGGVGSSTETGTSTADTMVGEEGSERPRESGEGWNKRRYQREDETLWGKGEEQESKLMGTSPVSRSVSGSASYYQARNPAVNDLHPPVVSTQPTHRSETQWMLQPPPKAKIMEGKERASTPNRSRSASGASKDSRASAKKPESLGRQVGERLVESKLKRGENPAASSSSVAMSRVSSARSTASSIRNIQGQPHDRDPPHPPPPLSLTSQPSSSEPTDRKAPPPPPITIPSYEPSLLPPPATRPPLSTIPSASSAPRSSASKAKDRPPPPPHLRPPLLSSTTTTTTSDSSLQVLQELVAPATQLNTLVPHKAAPNNDDDAVAVKLPPSPSSRREDAEVRVPEVESWFPATVNGWGFPSTWTPTEMERERERERMQEEEEGKKRRGQERGQRWSMDF